MTGAIRRYYADASDDPMISLTSNNKDIWLWRISSGSSAGVTTSAAHGFGLKYMGTGGTVNNNLILFADNQSGTAIEAIKINQLGAIIFAANTTAPGYIKINSNDNKVLTGGGGDKPISDFVLKSEMVDVVTGDYYWANLSVQDEPLNDTHPTFGAVTIGGCT
jgi:hypothetical protein